MLAFLGGITVLGNNKDKNIKPYRIQGGHSSQISVREQRRLRERYNAKTLNALPMTQVDFLFFVLPNATEKQLLKDGKIYHKIIDPVYEAALKEGTALKIEVLRTANLEEDWTQYQHPATLLLLDCNLRKYSENLSYDLSFHAKMQAYITALNTLNEEQLCAVIDYEFSIRDYYLDVLKKLKPKVVFINFYHRYAPLCSAAHELGILVVDLQHGLQKGWNPLYNHYAEAKDKGYQALPKVFAVWSERDSEHIGNTFGTNYHRAIVMGNPWLKRSLELTSSVSAPIDELDCMSSDEYRVLIILQKKHSIPILIKKIIDSSPTGFKWIIRHHPKGKKFRSSDFSKNGNVLVSNFIDQMSVSVLSACVHTSLSEGSAMSLELAQLGVEGVLFGDEGYKNYVDEISAGYLHHVETESEFFNIVANQATRVAQINSGQSHISGADTKLFDFVKSIIDLSERTD